MEWTKLISNKRLGQEHRHTERHDDRTEFKRDYDRLIFSNAINRGHQPMPTYATPQSAGMDLRANLEEPVVLHPMERRLIPTGLHIALPEGYEAQVRPRSGLALKHGLTVLNAPGTIDADYRGEIGVVLINLSQEDFTINDGERIAQLVVARYEQVEFSLVETLDETERGEGGYGHTGVK